jgi:rhodanese-related sulfurtransferase
MGLFDNLFGKRAVPAPALRPAPAPQPAQPPSEPREVGAQGLDALLAGPNPPLVIDVRETPELIADGWIPGSRHMPMSGFQGREGALDRSRPIVVQCASGIRSYDVGCHLLDQGFTDVSNLTGGIHAWTAARQRGVPPGA